MLPGQSPEIIRIKKFIREVAKTDDNILFIGETGVGKKYVAGQIHERSRLKNRPFVVINCTAVGDTLTDGNLFGETKETDRGMERTIGLFEQAHKGILYLENVHELAPEYQQKFINIFKESRFKRTGEPGLVKSEFRIFASTSDERLADQETFRKDLYAVLSAFSIQIPPLRKRKQDIPELFGIFLQSFCDEFHKEMPTVTAELFESLIEYEWRGNVQELKHAVRNLVLMSPEGQLALEYLPFEIRKHPFEFLAEKDLQGAISEVERYLIAKALRRFAGNQTKAARALNVSEAALRYKMKKYGLSRKTF